MEYPLGARVTVADFVPEEVVLRSSEGRITGPISGGDLLPVSFETEGGEEVVLDVPLGSIAVVHDE